MRDGNYESGILSYAGSSKDTLFAQAVQAFVQMGDAPARFASFVPIFPFELIQNMEYVGTKTKTKPRVAPSGFSIDPCEYHRKLAIRMPELYTGENVLRNYDYAGNYQGRSVFAVDGAWVEHFPQYQPFAGEKLTIYLLGGGHQAVAVPESLYPRGMWMLAAAEKQMQVTRRAEEFMQYAQIRMASGEGYDGEAFGADYLADVRLEPVTVFQREIETLLQEALAAKSLQRRVVFVGPAGESGVAEPENVAAADEGIGEDSEEYEDEGEGTAYDARASEAVEPEDDVESEDGIEPEPEDVVEPEDDIEPEPEDVAAADEGIGENSEEYEDEGEGTAYDARASEAVDFEAVEPEDDVESEDGIEPETEDDVESEDDIEPEPEDDGAADVKSETDVEPEADVAPARKVAPSRKPYSFRDLGLRPQVPLEDVEPARQARQNEKAARLINKGGKMAALIKRKSQE